MNIFDAKKVKNEIINWIKDWFENNGKGCNAVVGISGGVDSSVVAALCAEALGKDRVIGVLMPDHIQCDIEYSHMLCNHLGIKNYTIDVGIAIDCLLNNAFYRMTDIEISEQTKINLPPRIRMSCLYMVSQSVNGRVANTCNMSETYVGYDTRYGDSVGDFSPLANITKTEVIALAEELGLPTELAHKIPQDGLTGKSDEESFGFTYSELDAYIRDGIEPEKSIKNKIDIMHENNLFKQLPMPSFKYLN